MLKTDWRRWLQNRARGMLQGRRIRRPYRGRERSLIVESLESRLLLSVVRWNVDTNGDWNDAANWFDETALTNHVPSFGDDVVIDRAGANPNVTLSAGAQSARSVLVADTLTFAGGSLHVGGAPFVNAGTVLLTGDVPITGTTIVNQAGAVFDFQGDGDLSSTVGAFNNFGTLRKSAGVGESRIDRQFNQTNGIIEVMSGKLTLGADGVRDGGTISVSTDATFDLTGGSNNGTYSGTFTGSGAGRVELASGTLNTADPGVTFNLPAGLFHWTGGATAGSGSRPFVNAGSITLSGPNDRVVFGQFTNDGTIIHQDSGRLLVNTSSIFDTTATGLYDFQSDTAIGRIAIGGGFHPSFRVEGTLRKSGGTGTSTFDGEADGLDFNLTGATIDVQVGRLKIDDGGMWQGGVFNVATDAVLEMSGDRGIYVNGNLSGSGGGRVEWNVSNIGSYEFGVSGTHATFNFPEGLAYWISGGISSGGSASGIGSGTTFVNAGFLTLEGPAGKGIGGTGLINTGTIINAGPGDFGLGGATFDNRAGAVYEHRGDSVFPGTDQFGNAGRFLNAGLIEKTAGTGTVNVSAQIENTATGVIEVQSGRLKFSRGGNSTGGTFNVSAGATLEFGPRETLTFDTFNMQGTYTGSGPGTVEFNALLNGNDPANPARLDFPAGVFHMIGGQLLGDIVNVGTFDFAPTTGLFARAGITNLGTWIHSGVGDFVLNANSRFTNRGLYDLQTDADLVVPEGSGGSMFFINTGTFRKSGGLGTSTFRHDGAFKDLQFDNTGTLEVQTGTVEFLDPVVQFSGNTLTSGEWIARPFATIAATSASNLTTNKGRVTLDGSGSSFAMFNTLANNQGSFTLAGGRDFSTVGNLTNSGQLTVGPGSKLTVNGTLTESVANNLVSWWRGEGDTNDSASTNNGTLNGDTTFAAGQFGQAFSFDGSGDFVSIGNPAALRLQDFTISAFVKRDDLAKSGQIFGYGQSGYGFGMFADGKLFLTQVGVNHVQTSTLQVSDTDFHHLAVTKSGDTVTFFIDGVAEPTFFSTNFSFFTNAAIGSRTDSADPFWPFKGRIDEVAVFNRPLTAAEIQTLGTTNDPPAVGNLPPVLNIKISDHPATGQFGQINSTSTMTLTGRLEIDLLNGFGPGHGDDYPILNHASRVGTFTSTSGLDPFSVLRSSLVCHDNGPEGNWNGGRFGAGFDFRADSRFGRGGRAGATELRRTQRRHH